MSENNPQNIDTADTGATGDLAATGALNGAGAPAAAAQPVAGSEAGTVEQPWRRLATGMLLVEPVRELIKFIPMLVVLIFAGRAGESGPPWGLIGTAAVIALGISRWLTTRYRITPTVVEVRRGLLQRKHLTVPRDRIRTVDVSAHPLQRVLHLVKVEIGTGSSHQRAEALKLDGLPAATAGPLRAELLHRVRVAGNHAAGTNAALDGEVPLVKDHAPNSPTVTDPGSPPDPDAGPETELLRLDPRWIWYAPATLSGVLTGAVLIGFGWRIINEASIDPTQFSAVHQTLQYLQGTPLWVDALQGTAAVLIVVSLLSLAGYVLSYWDYRLTRHPGGTLQVSRGLLTTRATSIEERRLRGVHRVEPILLRLVGGARLQVIATGLRERGAERGSALLVPPAPLGKVIQVESVVLGSAEFGDAELVQHGPAARRRRYSRALGITALLAGVLIVVPWWANWPIFLGLIATAGLPVAALLARDRYRNLGHSIVHDVLITRMGSLVRRRSMLAVPGVIGVTLRQSFFQRRSGLLTVIATTAAGAQHYAVPDVPHQQALELAERLVPQAGSLRVAAGSTTEDHPAAALLRDGLDVSRLPA